MRVFYGGVGSHEGMEARLTDRAEPPLRKIGFWTVFGGPAALVLQLLTGCAP